MILTEQQNTAIVEYLINKGLSFDLLPEVHDHFATQIVDYTRQGNSFEQAFELVKEDWKEELKRDVLDAYVFPKIVVKAHKEERKRMYNKSYLRALPFFIVLMSSMFLFDFDYFRYILLATIAITLIIPLYFSIKIYQTRKKLEKRLHTKINFRAFHQEIWQPLLYLGCSISIIDSLFNPTSLYDTLLGKIIYTFFIAAYTVFPFYSFLAYKKMEQIKERTQPYLKYINL